MINFIDDNGDATKDGVLEFLRRLGEPGVAADVVSELDHDEDACEDDVDQYELADQALEILARATRLDLHTVRRVISMLSFTASVSGDALDFVTHNLDRDHEDERDECNLKGMASSVGFSLGEPEEEPA